MHPVTASPTRTHPRASERYHAHPAPTAHRASPNGPIFFAANFAPLAPHFTPLQTFPLSHVALEPSHFAADTIAFHHWGSADIGYAKHVVVDSHSRCDAAFRGARLRPSATVSPGIGPETPSRRSGFIARIVRPAFGRGLRTFSWRLNERILCSVKRSVVVPWSCISPLI